MEFQFTRYVIPLVLGLIISVTLVVVMWRRRPGVGIMSFVVLMLGVTEWTLGNLLELSLTDFQLKVLLSNLQYIGITTAVAGWFTLSLEYTGRQRWLTRRTVALLFIEPVATLAFALTNDLHHLFRTSVVLDTSGGFAVLAVTQGPAFWVHAAYSYILLLAGTALFIQAFIRSPELYRGQVVFLLTAAFVPWIANAVYLAGYSPFPNIDITPLAFVITGSAMAWSIYRYRLLDIVPVARETVIDGMDVAVMVIDARNRIVDANRAALQIVGLEGSAVIGKPAAEVLSGQPELVERYRDVIQGSADITVGGGEARRHFHVDISPLRNRLGDLTGRLYVLYDITALQKALDALRESEERYRTLFEATFESVIIHDQGQIMDVNRAFEAMFERPRAEVMGAPIASLIAEEFRDMVVQNTRSGVETPYEVIGLRKGGSSFDGEVRGKSMAYKGQPVQVMAVRDISDRKAAERAVRTQNEELVKTNRELAVARQKAEEATRLKTEFLSTMSHELRTPLNAIIGYSQIIIEGMAGEMAPKVKENQERIFTNAKTLLGLINEVLDLARIEAGRMELVNKPFDLRTWLSEVAQQTESLAKQKGLNLAFSLDDRLPPEIVGDAARLKQIALNLIGNAVKFTERGAVTVELRRDGTDTWMLAVSDTGIGIPSHAQEFIFEEFRQVDGSSQRHHGGSGLGLAIVRNLVLLMKGTVRVKSKVGEGSVFTVSLPLVTNHGEPADQVGARASA
jgi:PAS domain S-box-containing protein